MVLHAKVMVYFNQQELSQLQRNHELAMCCYQIAIQITVNVLRVAKLLVQAQVSYTCLYHGASTNTCRNLAGVQLQYTVIVQVESHNLSTLLMK